MIINLTCWMVLGLVVGLLVSKAMNRRHEGLPYDLALGIGGAVFAGWLSRAFESVGVTGLDVKSIAVAVFGAVFVLGIWHAIKRSLLRT